MPATDSISVGVLSLHSSKETKAILNAVEDLGHEAVWLREENSTIRIDSNQVQPNPAVDVLVNRLLLTNTDHPEVQLGLLQSYAGHEPMLNRPLPVLIAIHKFATATKLARNGVPVPDALLALHSPRVNDVKAQFGPECVYKTAIGTHGGGTWKVDTSQPLNARVGQRQAFLQAFLENDIEHQRDLRVYVVGDHRFEPHPPRRRRRGRNRRHSTHGGREHRRSQSHGIPGVARPRYPLGVQCRCAAASRRLRR